MKWRQFERIKIKPWRDLLRVNESDLQKLLDEKEPQGKEAPRRGTC
jgi:hypothetical protein